MKSATLALGAFAALAFGLGAQQAPTSKPTVAKTETVWTFQIRGISG